MLIQKHIFTVNKKKEEKDMELSHTLLFSAILPGTAFWRMKHTATYM